MDKTNIPLDFMLRKDVFRKHQDHLLSLNATVSFLMKSRWNCTKRKKRRGNLVGDALESKKSWEAMMMVIKDVQYLAAYVSVSFTAFSDQESGISIQKMLQQVKRIW